MVYALIFWLLLIVFAFGLEVILLMGYSNYEDMMQSKDQLLNSSNSFDRVTAKVLYALVEYRLLIGYLGIVGLMLSLAMS